MCEPSRAMLRYHGGKWALAPWVISHFPSHRIYVEPFGGAASVLLRKPRSGLEVYNDLDGEIVNVFRVMRDPTTAAELERQLRLTPYAMEEFQRAYELVEDPIEQARRTIIRSYMGFSSDSLTRKWRSGFRMKSLNSRHTTSMEWMYYPDRIREFTARLQGVVIMKDNALDLIRRYDTPKTLFYVDPPYLPSVRFSRGKKEAVNYNHELSLEDHIRLGEMLVGIQGMALVSGYESEEYDRIYSGWEKRSSRARISGGRGGGTWKTEVMWISPKVKSQLDMFQGVVDEVQTGRV